jgi:hypothetical protein
VATPNTLQRLRGLNPTQRQAFIKWTTAKAGGLAPSRMPTVQQADFTMRKHQVNQGYGNQLATLQHDRGMQAGQYGDQRRQLQKQFMDMRQQLPQDFAQMGQLTSGLYRQGLEDYGQNKTQTMGQFERERRGNLGRFDLQRQQLEGGRATQLADIERQRQAMLGQIALRLRGGV